MTIQDIGSIGELLGSIAVLITLIYLATQIRQNTRAIRASAVQALTQTVSTNIGNWAGSAENSLLFQRGLEHYHDLSDGERAQFDSMMMSIYLSIDSIYWLYRNEAIFSELWERERDGVLGWIARPGGRAVWEKTLITNGFRAHIEGLQV